MGKGNYSIHTHTKVLVFLSKLHGLSVELLQLHAINFNHNFPCLCISVSYAFVHLSNPYTKTEVWFYFSPAEARRGAVHLRPLQKQGRGTCVCLSCHHHGCKQGSCPKHSF